MPIPPRGLRVVLLALAGVGIIGAGPVDSTLCDVRIRSEIDETVVEAWTGHELDVEDRTRGIRTAVPEPGDLQGRPGLGGERAADESLTGPEGGAREGSGISRERRVAAEEPKRPPDVMSEGETFEEEIRLHLPHTPLMRSTSIIVGDPLVSEVRVLSQDAGSVLVIFIRQPVRYEVRQLADGRALRVRVRKAVVGVRGGEHRAVLSGIGDEREITVDAETVSYDRFENVILASGGVAITRPGTTLTAGEVRLNRSTYEGEAAGDVVLRSEGTVVRGDRVHLNLADETGWVEAGEIDLPTTGYVISGERISKGFGQTYRVQDGLLTTCHCGGLEPPSWSIAARSLDVDLLGHGTARDVKFRVRDVPVLYCPFAVFPVNRTRQSGFLMPRLGQSFGSSNRGFLYEQPFYWAIDKSSDATIAFDIETRARVGGVGEYRYALDRESRGTVAGTYFSEVPRSNEDLAEAVANYTDEGIVAVPPEDRWGAFTEMQQHLPGDVRAYANTMLVSDDLFFNEIDSASFEPADDQAARTRFYTATRIGMLKKWQGAGLWGESTFFQSLDPAQDNEDDGVLQRLPGVEFSAGRTVLGDRAALSVVGEAVDYQRRVGFDGMRLDLQPRVRIPFHFGSMIFGSLEGSIRETLYHVADGDRIGECRGGDRHGMSCTSDADCPGEGSCEINFRCNGGGAHGETCTSDSQCPGGGSCVIRPTGELPHRDRTRETFELGWRVGTEIARVYPFRRWGFGKLKHTIEPTVGYLFIPLVGGQDELPLFDGVDRINRRSLFSYGMVSRLIARPSAGLSDAEEEREAIPVAPPVRELARLSLLQVLDTQREIAGEDHTSDVEMGLRLTPNDLLALRYGATYNVGRSELRGTTADFSVREPWQAGTQQLALLQQPSHASIYYRFVHEGVAAQESLGQEDLGASFYLRLGRFLGLMLQGRFNLLAKEQDVAEEVVREVGAGARFISRCECWMLEVGVEDRADRSEDMVVRAQLTLAGIGSVGSPAGQGLLASPGLGQGQRWP